MTNIEQSSREESMESKIKRTAKKRAKYTRNFVAKYYTQKEFLNILAQFDIKEVDFNDDKSLALGVHNLQKKVGLPQNLSFRGCDGSFGAITRRKVSQAIDLPEIVKSKSTRKSTMEKFSNNMTIATPAIEDLPEKSNLEINCIEKTIRLGGMRVYMSYANNPELRRKKPAYYTFIPGDRPSISGALRLFNLKKKMEELRQRGINAVLIVPEDRRKPYWSKFRRNTNLVSEMFNSVGRETKTTPANIHIFSFSGGYRAVSSILDNEEYASKIRSVSMLDSTYGYKTQKKLVEFVKNGGKLNVVTGGGAKTNRGLRYLVRNLADNTGRGQFDYSKTRLGHFGSAKKYFPKYLLSTFV